MTENRKHSRVDSIYLLNYVHLDENDNAIMQGMGRTMNVSESGIMLETHVSLGKNETIDVVLGLQEEMLTIRGKVIFSRAAKYDMYQSGIQFLDIDDSSFHFLKLYIKAFHKKSAKE